MPSPTVEEKEALAAIEQLPDDSWLKQYVIYATDQCQANAAYHLINGLTALAVTCPPEYSARGPFVAKTLPNLWGLVVGESGRAQKTLAQNVVASIFDLLPFQLRQCIAPDPSAEETLVLSLALQPQQIIIDPDYGQFLHNTAGPTKYRSGIRPAMTRFFDGRNYSRIKASRSNPDGERLDVVRPRLSIMAACTPTHLEEFTASIDWQGGFMSRHMLMFAHRERPVERPKEDPERLSWLVGRLQQLFAFRQNVPVEDEVEPEGFACEIWDEWLTAHEARVQKLDPRVRGVIQRADLIAAKIATILTWDLGRCLEDGWQVQADVVSVAIQIADLHVKSAMTLIDILTLNDTIREQRRVHRAIEHLGASGSGWCRLGQIMKHAGVGKRAAQTHLDSLIEMQEVEFKGIDVQLYRLRTDPCWDDVELHLG